MKSYNQTLNKALLIGAHSYFNGGSQWIGAHDYLDAVSFIYEVDRADWMNDYDRRWDQLMSMGMTSDGIIAFLKSRIQSDTWG